MRSDCTVMSKIIKFAKENKSIRAVYMNGSRTNHNAPSDIFRDFDIVYVVEDIKPFRIDKSWINYFGDILIMQEPDLNDKLLGRSVSIDERYAFMMLFSDGIRIDLSFQSISKAKRAILEDKLVLKLLDKDQLLPSLGYPTDIDYHIKKPSEARFTTRCNDFWWCMQNVAKGLWRDEVPYAMEMFNSIIRMHLNEIIDYYIGIEYNFSVASGKMKKYFKRYLPKEYYDRYLATYSDAKADNIWNAIFVACDLFSDLAQTVASNLNFNYNMSEEKAMRSYLVAVMKLDEKSDKIF